MKHRSAAPAGATAQPLPGLPALRKAAEDCRAHPPDKRGRRAAAAAPSTYDPAAHTVELVLSTGADVTRWGYIERLLVSPEAVDLSRMRSGALKVLNSHNAWDIGAILGTIVDARFESGMLVGVCQFAETPAAREAEGMVARGELVGVSVGYEVSVWRAVEIVTDPTSGVEITVWCADRWALLEASFVSVPADPNAGVRAAVAKPGATSAIGGTNEDTEDMKTRSDAPAADAPDNNAGHAAAPEKQSETAARGATAPETPAPETRHNFTPAEAVEFVEQARSFDLTGKAKDLIAKVERGEVTPEAARAALLSAAAEKQRAGTPPAGSAARAVDDGAEKTREAIIEALVARATRKQPSERAREFASHRLLEIAIMRTPGLNPRERDAVTILRAANTTSDFPLILEAAANKILLDRYQTATPTYRAIARQRDLKDFKTTKLLRIGDFPTLQSYQEDGEIKAGTINEGREEVTLGSYGRILRLSRQAIVNDDLNAFDEVFGSIGFTIALFENATFFAMKGTTGPTLSDGKAVFHSGHSNLAASGSAISVTSLGAARAAIRKQKNLDGNVMNLNPSILFVGADKETEAQQQVASITPRNPDDVNPFSGKLSVVAEGSVSGNAWEVYADPAIAPVFVFGYLADSPGPRVLTDQPFNFDGMAWRVTLDFYAGAIDYRGAYRNPGA